MSVIVYGAKWCGYCDKVKQYLTDLGKDYQYVDIDDEPVKMMGILKEYKISSIPQVFINDKHIGGYEDTINFLGE
ncbi:glutaredoxin [Shewanella sp. phage 1/40]|uniref:thioredoxin domain n=1 Tax=Shewanella sp. phage 1/40 TaxID=1458860 RepID=UPI0004F7BD8C|nr:thioredoxin domain [Shewanella sp. phage 1/40]AHK11436.1 glutaredoxin [Shewanella sp. phage 1/40]